MPKERKNHAMSSDRSRASPYPCSSRGPLLSRSESSSKDIKEWEDARCPVCMEHPHNAVLLICSSHEKGCRPYMCDTSHRHSNCLDQFCKSSAESPPAVPVQEDATPSMVPRSMRSSTMRSRATMNLLPGNEGWDLNFPVPIPAPTPTVPCENQVKQNLLCPLCRGQISGWIVVEPARCFMNSKTRSCACETCDFSGTYTDLRNHARVEHPFVRPTEADPGRQDAWRRLERERDLGDVLSTMRSSFMDEDAESFLATEGGSLMTVFFLFRVFRPASGNDASSSRWSNLPRTRGQSALPRARAQPRRQRRTLTAQPRRQRRTLTLWGENYESDTSFPAVDDDNDPPERLPSSRRRNERR